MCRGTQFDDHCNRETNTITKNKKVFKIKIQKTFGKGKIKIVKKNNVACC
jgi:hypothetical protein